MNHEIEEARLQSIALDRSRSAIADKLARKEKKKEKKKRKHSENTPNSESDSPYNSNQGTMSEVELNGAGVVGHVIPSEMLPSENALEEEARERQAEEERRKNREPPIVFKEIDVSCCCCWPQSIFV